jgi:hypothetical protein
LQKIILKEYFGRIFWKNILRGSGNNLLDLLYNLNKPSNTIRPRGLGGILIKKNYPKKAILLPPGNFLFAALILLSGAVGT